MGGCLLVWMPSTLVLLAFDAEMAGGSVAVEAADNLLGSRGCWRKEEVAAPACWSRGAAPTAMHMPASAPLCSTSLLTGSLHVPSFVLDLTSSSSMHLPPCPCPAELSLTRDYTSGQMQH